MTMLARGITVHKCCGGDGGSGGGGSVRVYSESLYCRNILYLGFLDMEKRLLF